MREREREERERRKIPEKSKYSYEKDKLHRNIVNISISSVNFTLYKRCHFFFIYHSIMCGGGSGALAFVFVHVCVRVCAYVYTNRCIKR